MKNRRSFLTAVASGSVGLSLVARDPVGAQVTQVTPAPLMPAVAPAPSATKLPSFQSAALAEGFNVELGAGLTDEQRTAVAFAIDANRKAALALNPRKKRLRNSDEPVIRFAVPVGEP